MPPYRPSHRAARPSPIPRLKSALGNVGIVAAAAAVAAGAIAPGAPRTEPSPEVASGPAGRVVEGVVFSEPDRQARPSRSQSRAELDDRLGGSGRPESVKRKKRSRQDSRAPRERREDRRPAARTSPAPTDLDPRVVARQMMPAFGFADSEFGCLNALYVSESDWEVHADNPTSTAYGIPQALLSEHEVPADYMTNPVTQIRWGLGYIRDSYGTPCAAWEFKQANNYY